MKTVKLTFPVLIGDHHYPADTAVSVEDGRAKELIEGGHAVEHDGEPTNLEHVSPLADCIKPHPPGGLPFNPADAIAPNVADNPGLTRLAEIAAEDGSVTVTPARVASKDVHPGHVTANEVEVSGANVKVEDVIKAAGQPRPPAGVTPTPTTKPAPASAHKQAAAAHKHATHE